ncbi:hypothetical protein ACLOJK_029925, partial [Asimina triloba]
MKFVEAKGDTLSEAFVRQATKARNLLMLLNDPEQSSIFMGDSGSRGGALESSQLDIGIKASFLDLMATRPSQRLSEIFLL